MTQDTLRPDPDPSLHCSEFARWYWSVAELRQFCEALGVSSTGTKAVLRDRVAAALAGDLPSLAALNVGRAAGRNTGRRVTTSPGFDWRRAPLSLDTVITETVSFGPNLRGFFKDRIGRNFVCHGDFMDWMRQNPGQTLRDAIDAWWLFEERKADPSFRREIAECNNYLQYLRDVRDAHPNLTLDEARQCWDEKKRRPAVEGRVVYEAADLRFLSC